MDGCIVLEYDKRKKEGDCQSSDFSVTLFYESVAIVYPDGIRRPDILYCGVVDFLGLGLAVGVEFL